MAESSSQPNRPAPASGSGNGSGDASGPPSRNDRYLVAARKYRPALFKEVVAQQHVTDTLKNALKLDRLAHAYLFSGPRGVGKTTTARILAKAINCETPREEREDASEPCRECDSCQSFEAGRSLNVFEMDAASNNKVDDIRELRETVRIPPQGSTKKVYILDEVHMLSTQAFNALLKTLEEPPPHALFIFATTEPHKVLPTILSRCQRFDFRRIPVPRIVDHLRRICENEGIEADEESLMLLARKGDGALRDALSAFDQAISLCGTTLEYGDLTQALGVVDQDLFFRLTDHVAHQDTAGVLKLVNHIVRSGYDLQEFLGSLAEHVRNLLVARSLGDDALEEVASSTRQRYAREAERFGEADLLRLLTIAGDAEDDVKSSSQPRLKLEMALLKMAQMRRAADLKQVLQKIDRLEQLVEDGDLPDALPGEPGAAPSTTASASAPDDGSAPNAAPAGSTPSASADDTAPSSTAPDSPSSPPDRPASSDGTRDDASGPDAPPAESSAPNASATDTASAETSVPEGDAAPDAAPDAGAGVDEGADAQAESTDVSTAAASEQAAASPDEPAAASEETDGDGPLPEAPDDPEFTTPFDEGEEDDPSIDPEGGLPAGEEPEDPDDGGVGYGDLFGTPALDRKSGSGASTDADGESARSADASDASSGASGDGSAAQAASDVSYGDGQAGGAVETSVVAEPGDAAQDPAGSDGSSVLQAVQSSWTSFVQAVMSERISLGALLGDAEATRFDGRTLVVAAPKSLHRDQFRTHRPYLLQTLQEVVEAEVESLEFIVDRTDASEAAQETEESLDPQKKMERLRESYPALDRLFDQFGAELVW